MEKFNAQLILLERTFVEKYFVKNASKDQMISMRDFVSVVSDDLCLGISKLELRITFEFFLSKQNAAKGRHDPNGDSKELYFDAFLDQAFKTGGKDGSDDFLSPRSKLKRIHQDDGDSTIISRRTKDDISDSVRNYLKSSNSANLGKLLLQNAEGKGGSQGLYLNRRQFRRFFVALGTQLSDKDETSLFECLNVMGDGNVSIHDIIIYCYDLAFETDNLEAAYSLKMVLERKKVSPKEFYRSLQKCDVKKTSYIDVPTFEKVVSKIYGMVMTATEDVEILKSDDIVSLLNYFDHNKEGRIDIEYASAMSVICLDVAKASSKLRNMLKFLRIRHVDYLSILCRNMHVDTSAMVTVDEFVSSFSACFAMPILGAELHLLANRYQKRNKLNLESMFEKIERSESDDTDPSDRKGKSSSALKSGAEEFGRNLLKKIYKLRANPEKHFAFRSAVLSKDHDMTGSLSRRDLQRIFDTNQYLDLTDEESALLIENLSIRGSDSQSDVDYPLLLLLLHEPISNIMNVSSAGISIVKKINRESDLNSFLKRIFLRFIEADSKNTGMITVKVANKIFIDECGPDIEEKTVKSLVTGFHDSKSDCILYVELISFLNGCSVWDVMNRLNRIESIRQKQGYNFQDFLIKFTQKNGNIIDTTKFKELFTTLGIIVLESSIVTIYTVFGTPSNKSKILGLETQKFVTALTDANDDMFNGKSAYELKSFDDDNRFQDDGVREILREYDDNIQRAIQKAFDVFDVKNTNEIASVELERVLNSLGFSVYMEELLDLTSLIDPRTTGVMEFNSFMTHTVEFIRSKYQEFSTLNIEQLRTSFNSLDQDGDGTLNHYEFMHIIESSSANQGSSCRLSEDETTALIKFLDMNEDGTISWSEFKQIYDLMIDPDKMSSLPMNIQRAIRKIQYASLPNPQKYLAMFKGLPFTYRRSILAEVDLRKENSFDYVVCRNPNFENQKVDSSKEIQFQVQITRVIGVPTEDAARKQDVLHRGVRFCLCKCATPPTEEEAGTVPEFIGNVMKLHATINPSEPDRWQFANKDELDPDKSCFVRCGRPNSESNSRGNLNQTRVSNSQSLNISQLMQQAQSIDNDDEPLYLFIELVTSFRVPQGAAAAAIEPDVKKPINEQKVVSSSTDFRRSTNSLSSLLRNSKIFKSKTLTTDPAAAGTDTTLIERMNEDSKAKLIESIAEHKDNENSFQDDAANMSSLIPRSNHTNDGKPLVTVEMCSCWAMVPVSEIIAGGKLKQMKIQMKGGTPFLTVKITKNDIKKRPGIVAKVQRNAMRLFGIQRKSILEISVTSMASVAVVPEVLSVASASTTVGTSVHASTQSLLTKTYQKQSNDMIPTEPETIRPLTYYLPPYVLLPTRGAPIVAIYRLQLTNALKLVHDPPERVLPQSNLSAPIADVLLSNFPQFLSDLAASRVLLFLWSREAPEEFIKKTINLMTTSDLENPRILEVFRDIIHRLYRACHCVDAQPNRLNPIETIEELYSREARIKNYATMMTSSISVEKRQAAVTSRGALMSSISVPASANLLNESDAVVMHVPFNTRELFWQQENHNM